MGTPALIIVEERGQYRTIVCSGDGYLDHTGDYLQHNITTPKQALALVSKGDVRGFYDTIEHFPNHGCKTFSTIKEALHHYGHINNIYLFEKCVWSMIDYSSCRRLYWYPEPDFPDFVYLECSVCGFEEQVISDDDFGGWVSEAFLGLKNLGPVCPNCQAIYTRINGGGECEIILREVDLTECPGLVSAIKSLVSYSISLGKLLNCL